ncbi:MAG: NAD(+) synthase [Candidatus Eisenbacteria bacterium]|nr:NAD(+) synthase [Candidatus Eisenbacteria bacterium]
MLTKDVLRLDAAAAVSEIEEAIRSQVLGTLKRRGVVVGVSGGIDSSVTAALCARALGGERVQALLMPERDSSDASLELGRALGTRFGIPTLVENIGPIVAAAGCYERQDEAIRMVFPDYRSGWKFKVTLPSILDGDRINVSELTVQSPDGASRTAKVPLKPYLQLIAATNFKQRIRKMMEYYHADRLNYAVAGTPNRLEYDQGFFVKQGDGAADFKPIAHLYKTQVFQLAEHLGVPDEIRRRTPTTDTFSLPQTQEEFYFALPYDRMDLCLYGRNHGVPAAELAGVVGLTAEQVERVYRDIDQKRRSTRYLQLHPMLVHPVAEISH